MGEGGSHVKRLLEINLNMCQQKSQGTVGVCRLASADGVTLGNHAGLVHLVMQCQAAERRILCQFLFVSEFWGIYCSNPEMNAQNAQYSVGTIQTTAIQE